MPTGKATTGWLIREHGFNMVAVEADWPDAAAIDRHVKGLPPRAGSEPPFQRFPTWMWKNRDFAAFTTWLRHHNKQATAPCGFYGLDIYTRYRAVQQIQQAEVRSRKPSIGPYFEALNTLDDELYRAWHQWGLTNREALIAKLQAQKARLISGDVMVQERLEARSIWLAAVNEQNTTSLLDFNEQLEQEIADTDPTLKDAARQNRDCADHAVRLLVKINHIRAEIAKDKRSQKPVQTARAP